jgi:hypothetical protein
MSQLSKLRRNLHRLDIQNIDLRCLSNDVKFIIKRSLMFLSQLRDRNNDQPLKVQSLIGFSSFVCFVSFAFMYWIAEPVVKLLEVDWAISLVDTIVPISVTFVTLYRSCWHREITGAARTLSLIVLSCVIFGGVMIAFVIMIVMLYVAYSTFFVGFSNFHY